MFSANKKLPQRKDIAIIDLKNADEEENSTLIFHLSSEIIKIKFHQFCKYSLIIQEECENEISIKNIIEKLEAKVREYHIKEENIKNFFNLLKKEKIEINSDQFSDFCKLAEIFKVNSLKKCLKAYSQKFSDDLNFNINLLLKQKKLMNCSLLITFQMKLKIA